MAELLTSQLRGGRITQATSVAPDQTGVLVTVRPDLASLTSLTAAVALRLTVEQSGDGGASWFPFGGCYRENLRNLRLSRDKQGVLSPWVTLKLSEQVYRDDIITLMGFPTRRLVPTDTAGRYHQLCCCPTFRVTVDTFTTNAAGVRLADAGLLYSVDFDAFDALPVPILLGRRSASVIGTFSGGEAASLAVTSASRTSTAGSLLTVGSGHFRDTTAPTSFLVTDSKSNSYTDVELGISLIRLGIGYNNAGTRGTLHTVTSTASGGTGASPGSSITVHEWGGIDASPTIVSATNTATGTAVSAAVAVSAASLALGVVVYNGASTTIAVASGTTEIAEQDENSDLQAQNCGYKVAQTGTPQLDWTLGASRLWGAVIVCFTEAAAGAAFLAKPLKPVLQAINRSNTYSRERVLYKTDEGRCHHGVASGGDDRDVVENTAPGQAGRDADYQSPRVGHLLQRLRGRGAGGRDPRRHRHRGHRHGARGRRGTSHKYDLGSARGGE